MIAKGIGEFDCVSYEEGERVAFFEGKVTEVASYGALMHCGSALRL